MKINNAKLCKNLFIGFIFILLLKSACFAYDSEAIKAYNKGIDMTGKEKYEKAILLFQKAIKINPSFIDAYYNLGILEEFMGNNNKAVETFKTLLKYTPEDYEVIYKIAVIYYNMGKKEETLAFTKQIPTENPNFSKITKLFESKENSWTTIVHSEIESPSGIAKDSKGNLYVANFSDNSIIFINKKGDKKIIAEGGAIKGPIGLAIDKNDNLYAANYNSNEIIILPFTDRIPQVLPINVNKPYFLMIDSDILYVTEQGNNSVSEHRLF